MLGQLASRLRRLMKSSLLPFHHVTIDNCPALRYALVKQLNGLRTREYLRKASRIVTGRCTAAEIRGFVPMLGCMAHYVRSELDYCKKYNVKKTQQMLHLRVSAETLATTSVSVYQFLLINYVILLSQRFYTESCAKALACVAEICGFNVKRNENPEDFVVECCKRSSQPDVVWFF